MKFKTLVFILEFPLLHDWVTKSTLNFMMDKFRRRLQTWSARNLSIASKITLAQSVLSAIPNYFMQTMLIPKGICDELERPICQFIWGSTEGHSKISLVGWNSICQPKSCRGLDLRGMLDQNVSFFMNIGFHLLIKDKALWDKVLRTKYNLKHQILDSITRSQCSHLWKSFAKSGLYLERILLGLLVMMLELDVRKTIGFRKLAHWLIKF